MGAYCCHDVPCHFCTFATILPFAITLRAYSQKKVVSTGLDEAVYIDWLVIKSIRTPEREREAERLSVIEGVRFGYIVERGDHVPW